MKKGGGRREAGRNGGKYNWYHGNLEWVSIGKNKQRLSSAGEFVDNKEFKIHAIGSWTQSCKATKSSYRKRRGEV